VPDVFIHGAAGTVTGSCFLLEFEDKRILLDCGLVQADRRKKLAIASPFPLNPTLWMQ
jgi:metallo-beta-lactamase family protein